jgi:hypothetical protein
MEQESKQNVLAILALPEDCISDAFNTMYIKAPFVGRSANIY